MSKVDNFSFCCCKIPYQCLEYNSFCYGMLSFPTFCLPCLYMSHKKLIIYEYNSLFNILNEIKENLNFELIKAQENNLKDIKSTRDLFEGLG